MLPLLNESLLNQLQNKEFDNAKNTIATSGIDLDARDKVGNHLLHFLAGRGHAHACELIIAKYGVDLNVLNHQKITPLSFAVLAQQKNTVECLLKHGADTNIQDEDRETVLHHAAAVNCFEIMEKLLEYRVPLNIQNKKGQTALHIAIKYSSEDVVRLLLKENAVPDIQTESGNTACHYAAIERRPQLLPILFEYAAGVDIQNKKGDTLLHLIASRYDEQPEDTEMLLTAIYYGADPTIKNKQDRTPTDIAIGKHKQASLQIIQDFSAKLYDNVIKRNLSILGESSTHNAARAFLRNIPIFSFEKTSQIYRKSLYYSYQKYLLEGQQCITVSGFLRHFETSKKIIPDKVRISIPLYTALDIYHLQRSERIFSGAPREHFENLRTWVRDKPNKDYCGVVRFYNMLTQLHHGNIPKEIILSILDFVYEVSLEDVMQQGFANELGLSTEQAKHLSEQVVKVNNKFDTIEEYHRTIIPIKDRINEDNRISIGSLNY